MKPCFFIQGHGRKILSRYLETDRGKSKGFQPGKKMVQKSQSPSLSAKRLFGKELIQIDRGAVSAEKAGYMRARGHSFCSLKGNGKLV